MEQARFVGRDEIDALRGERGFASTVAGLWCVGALECLRAPAVAIVGTRAATAYGRGLARRFAIELGRAGCCIVSGLALGIDAAAHEGALESGAPTVGVLGGGHAHFFPRRNRELAERMIVGGGAVLSPFAPEQQPFRSQFLDRNAVVAALADAVVVIEAPARSGALNTAHWAADRVPVLAVPGDVDRAHVAGCHALIRDGAILARSAEDVLEVLDVQLERDRRTAPTRDGTAGALLRGLRQGERTLDELVAETLEQPATVLATLALLEFEGLVERRGTRFACRSG